MSSHFTPVDPARFNAAIQRFDTENAKDPNTETVGGQPRPKELLYAERLTAWVLRLNPDASEPLRLAARCQHLCRWEIARDSYPRTRAGYLKWRQDLKEFHATKSGEILRELGYGAEVVQRVRDLNLKKNLGSDPDCQTLEDALCLVFLEHQFGNLSVKTDRTAVLRALRKSWAKMSEAGRAEALKLNYTEAQKELLDAALSDDG